MILRHSTHLAFPHRSASIAPTSSAAVQPVGAQQLELVGAAAIAVSDGMLRGKGGLH